MKQDKFWLHALLGSSTDFAFLSRILRGCHASKYHPKCQMPGHKPSFHTQSQKITWASDNQINQTPSVACPYHDVS